MEQDLREGGGGFAGGVEKGTPHLWVPALSLCFPCGGIKGVPLSLENYHTAFVAQPWYISVP